MNTSLKTIKKSTITLCALCLIAIGSWIGLQSFQKEAVKSSLAPEAQSFEYRWYELEPTMDDNPSQQTLADVNPISAPLPTDTLNCAQELNDGEFCAVAVKFEANTTDFTLEGDDLAEAISNHSSAISIATGVTTVDIDGDGYSQKPELPKK